MENARVFRFTLLALVVLILIHDAVALAINPDFGLGAAAHTVKFMGVDYNGWHAVAGFVFFGPGLFIWRRADLSRIYAHALVLGLLVTAGWGLLDEHPLGILTLPDQRGDAIFHITVGSVFALLILADTISREVRRPASADLA